MGILSDGIGLRQTAVIGSLIGGAGLIGSAFVQHLELLFLTFGLLLGFGCACTYSLSVSILSHYFKRRIGLANGLNASGPAMFAIVFSFAMPEMYSKLGLKYSFLILAFLFMLSALCALTWKPLIKQTDVNSVRMTDDQPHTGNRKCFNGRWCKIELFKNKAFILWSICIAVGLLVNMVPKFFLASIFQ